MSTVWWILLIILALIAGVFIGFYVARRYMVKYLEENPPINEEMLSMLMMQMGQKPSRKKINQMMKQMNRATDKAKEKK